VLAHMCQRFWGEALDFLECRPREPFYDGTLASMIRVYEAHKASPFHKLKPGPSRVYSIYCAKLARRYGRRRLGFLTGLDILRWFADWRAGEDGGDHLGAASTMLNVLRAVLSFGQLCGLRDCAELRRMLRVLRLPDPRPRNEAPTAADVIRAIDMLPRRSGSPWRLSATRCSSRRLLGNLT
jgi:hypothetical protein